MKRVHIYLAAAFLSVVALNYGCGGKSEFVQGENLDWAKLKDQSMAGKTVTIEGYPELPMLMMNEKGRSTVNLHMRMNQYGGGMVILSLEEGKGENQMNKLPGDYEQKDLVIRDSKGQEIHYGEKMRVTGEAKLENNKYKIKVSSIQKVDAAFDYEKAAVRLTDSTDADKMNEQLVYAEGEIEVKSEQSNGIRLEMYMDDTTLYDAILCKFSYGPLNNQANELPDSFSEDDVLIRDNTGKKITEGSRVRVYGMWYPEKEMIAVEKVVLLQ